MMKMPFLGGREVTCLKKNVKVNLTRMLNLNSPKCVVFLKKRVFKDEAKKPWQLGDLGGFNQMGSRR